MSHLGMNGYDEVYITEDVVKDLEEEIKMIFLVRSHLTDSLGSAISRTICQRIQVARLKVLEVL